jgi:hypothetical protein
MPFLIDGDFHLVGCTAIIPYLIEKGGKMDLLGITEDEKIQLDLLRSQHDLKDAILSILCNNSRQNCSENEKKCLVKYWKEKI